MFADVSLLEIRRKIRPFFLDSTGGPKPTKVYYDVLSWFVTQFMFAFTTTPFLLLSLPQSLLVWGRMYYFGLVASLVTLGFFASPAAGFLRSRLSDGQQRRDSQSSGGLKHSDSHDILSAREPMLGLSVDPEKDVSEAMAELKEQLVRQRQRKAQ